MTLGVVLSGGKGNRLSPLTKNRAKPAVPLGGTHRLVDIPLSNLINSHIRKIYVVTQFESRSLHTHVQEGYTRRVGQGEFVYSLASRQGNSTGGWSRGTAEAVYQNMDYLEKDKSSLVDVIGSDQVYVMDFSQMNAFHAEKGADLTIAVLTVKKSIARGLGIVEVDSNWRIKSFEEKPENPKTMPGNKEYCLASMGKYAFGKDALFKALIQDAKKEYTREEDEIKNNPDKFSRYDFGYDLIPAMLREGKSLFAYDFSTNSVPGQQEHEVGFWVDVGGSIEDYYKLSMQLRSSKPPINLHNDEWEIFTYMETNKPVQFKEKGFALESIVANGSIIRGMVRGSIMGYNTVIMQGAEVTDTILMGGDIGKNMVIGNGAIIKNSIIDKRVKVPDKETVGVDEEKDRERGFYDYSTNAVRPVVPADYVFPEK
jgi:glucose-1-phosphate adenylyltransferase